MTTHTDPARYGEQWAEGYDDLYQDLDAPADLVTFIDTYASTRSLLELGVGTGRVALPLAAAGYRVHGVDGSPEMLRLLAAKPGAERITLTEGDMSEFALDARFGVVTCVFSSLFLLPDQESQLRCLRTAAAHATPDGVVIVEGMVVNPQRWNNGGSIDIKSWTDDEIVLNAGRLDRERQVIETVRVEAVGDRPRIRRNRLRYALPAELDLMARLAGLELVHRAQDFTGAPYTRDSDNQVSVYRLA